MKPRFNATVKTEWYAHRKMRVLNTLIFTDKKAIKWIVPEDSVVDGASIPRFMWRFIGSPFVGKYRRASVVHDLYCVTKSKPHSDVHKMFYEAMICDGVSKVKAKVMYYSVKFGGPKW